MSTDTSAPAPAVEAPDIQAALADIAAYDKQRTRYIAALEVFTEETIAKLKGAIEEARQEAGRERVRAEAAEAVLQQIVEEAVGYTSPFPGYVVWRARVALGLDGRTGGRDVHAEADHG